MKENANGKPLFELGVDGKLKKIGCIDYLNASENLYDPINVVLKPSGDFQIKELDGNIITVTKADTMQYVVCVNVELKLLKVEEPAEA